ncbi:MAG TPA: ATP phosphoribosyltransferase regulatory subunit [Acetobacteraceae bacterium]|nr:ATP phosphoribosyltransferase regulatory subunit [Acetobacteraceae bacterium]
MTDDMSFNKALLPAGFADVLPPDAEIEGRLVATLLEGFGSHGYQQVKPPLLEFEATLLTGSGAAVAEQTFRLMDPESQRMMGLRADITPQIARIASTRLAEAARPLRLSYSGQCLLVRGSQLAPERQVAQGGIELIGPDLPQADAEIVLVAVAALAAVGVTHISVDLTMPPLIPALIAHAGLKPEQQGHLSRALDRKDAACIAAEAGPMASLLLALLNAAGAADAALAALGSMELPEAVRPMARRLADTVAAIRAVYPRLQLTIDPVEFRGYRYHTGIAVTIFALNSQAELGRGGRYLCDGEEPATGITLYPDTIKDVAPKPRLRPRLFLPAGTPPELAGAMREQGYAAMTGFMPAADPAAEAERLGCTHFWRDGQIISLEGS